MEEKFTIEEIRNYLETQDSMGDIYYYLSAENIRKANVKSRGCCDECGEGYDNDPEWRYNTECALCGHPIPEDLIIKPLENEEKSE